jgi:hypothetical protein
MVGVDCVGVIVAADIPRIKNGKHKTTYCIDGLTIKEVNCEL